MPVRYALVVVPNPLVTPGDVDIGANKLKTTDIFIKQFNVNSLSVRNLGDTNYKNIYMHLCVIDSGVYPLTNDTAVFTDTIDGHEFLFYAKDSGVGDVEVGRLQGAADPYFKATLGCVIGGFAAGSEPGTPVEGMLIYDSTAKILKYWNGTLWKPTSTI